MHAVKSFYSLDYTEEGDGGLLEASEDALEDDGSRLEDYNKIIQELQSHRKEIEKLQIGGTGPTSSSPQNGCENQSKQIVLSPALPLVLLKVVLTNIFWVYYY